MKNLRKVVSIIILVAFGLTSVLPPAFAQSMPWMPQPGTMVPLSQVFTPAILQGITIHPEDPLKFDFIVYKGDENLNNDQKQEIYKKLIKYFLASLAVPDDKQWVNLSPYEKDRIIEEGFGKTEMGRDLLAQDYLLKQLTSSLMFPENEMGKAFWEKVYKQANAKYGTTDIPVDTFNKIWIMPDEALIYEKGQTAYVLKNHLKVMLEEDYVALEHNSLKNVKGQVEAKAQAMSAASSQILKEIILPAIEKEVNEGKNFAALRQVYSGMILSAWYKKVLKESLLGKIYADKSKVKGVDQENPQMNQEIYDQYVTAFKKGVYNLIKEEYDPKTQSIIPRKYFSGGAVKDYSNLKITPTVNPQQSAEIDNAMSATEVVVTQLDNAMIGQNTAQAKEYLRQFGVEGQSPRLLEEKEARELAIFLGNTLSNANIDVLPSEAQSTAYFLIESLKKSKIENLERFYRSFVYEFAGSYDFFQKSPWDIESKKDIAERMHKILIADKNFEDKIWKERYEEFDKAINDLTAISLSIDDTRATQESKARQVINGLNKEQLDKVFEGFVWAHAGNPVGATFDMAQWLERAADNAMTVFSDSQKVDLAMTAVTDLSGVLFSVVGLLNKRGYTSEKTDALVAFFKKLPTDPVQRKNFIENPNVEIKGWTEADLKAINDIINSSEILDKSKNKKSLGAVFFPFALLFSEIAANPSAFWQARLVAGICALAFAIVGANGMANFVVKLTKDQVVALSEEDAKELATSFLKDFKEKEYQFKSYEAATQEWNAGSWLAKGLIEWLKNNMLDQLTAKGYIKNEKEKNKIKELSINDEIEDFAHRLIINYLIPVKTEAGIYKAVSSDKDIRSAIAKVEAEAEAVVFEKQKVEKARKDIENILQGVRSELFPAEDKNVDSQVRKILMLLIMSFESAYNSEGFFKNSSTELADFIYKTKADINEAYEKNILKSYEKKEMDGTISSEWINGKINKFQDFLNALEKIISELDRAMMADNTFDSPQEGKIKAISDFVFNKENGEKIITVEVPEGLNAFQQMAIDSLERKYGGKSISINEAKTVLAINLESVFQNTSSILDLDERKNLVNDFVLGVVDDFFRDQLFEIKEIENGLNIFPTDNAMSAEEWARAVGDMIYGIQKKIENVTQAAMRGKDYDKYSLIDRESPAYNQLYNDLGVIKAQVLQQNPKEAQRLLNDIINDSAYWVSQAKEVEVFKVELQELANQTLSDQAMSAEQPKYGGIDFNAANLNMQIKRDGNGVALPVSQQNLENIRIDGLIPIILDIKPAVGILNLI